MKKTIKQIIPIILMTTVIISLGSCKKQDDWLNARRSLSDVTPETLADYQEILNSDGTINNDFSTIGLGGCDNLYVTNAAFPGLISLDQDAYLWKRSIWDDQSGFSNDWTSLFKIIEFANVVLDGLKNISASTAGYNDLKGQALFYRAICYYNLAQVFCKQYDASTAATDLGLPIRLTSDVNVIYQRSNLQQTYAQMLSDASQAAGLLNDEPALDFRRPYKYADWGLLAKIYLVMNDYTNAGLYANNVLTNVSSLLDFNSSLVSLGTTYRFPANGINNPEILFYASSTYSTIARPTTNNKAFVDTTLYSSYNNNDLRKTYFFATNGTNHQFRGAYTGGNTNFCGIATDEIYLIRAECFARQGNTASALNDLNALLKKRFATGTFTDLSADNAKDALSLILQERRKELPFTGNIRWEDLRRLNKDPDYQKTIVRVINGTTYTLPPNDNRYVLPIPSDEIQLSGLQQNPN